MVLKIGELEFKNKTSADNYVKLILRKYQNGNIFTKKDCDFIISALEYRKKYGDGINLLDVPIKEVFVKKIGTKPALMLKRKDNSIIEINYNKFFSKRRTHNKFNNTNQMNRFLKALRYEIADNIRTIEGNTKKVDVHHKSKEFRKMAQEFIKTYNIDVNDVMVAGLNDVQKHASFVDRKLAKEWVRYHNNHSKLSLVTPEKHKKLHKK